LAAWRLAGAGLRVVLVERGGPAVAGLGPPSTLSREPSINLYSAFDPAWPYRSPATDGHGPYDWLRAAGLGGRLNFWHGTSLRMGADDFRDSRGAELEWPLTYGDLEPYYHQMEAELGCGGDGVGFPTDLVDEWVATAARECGVQVEPAHQATYSDGASEIGPEARFRCLSPLDHWVPDAMASGRCTVLPFTSVRRVLTAGGRAVGVEAVGRPSGAVVTIRASTVLLATSTIETARVLVESSGPDHPKGLGNDTDLVGSRLMDHVVVWARALVAVPSDRWTPGRPLQTGYIRRWPTGPGAAPPSRFHVQVAARDVTGVSPVPAPPGHRVVAIVLGGVGEGLAIAGNQVVLDPAGERDAHGHMVPLVRFRWDQPHLDFARRMHEALLGLLAALPCEVLAIPRAPGGTDALPSVGGHGHEVGTAWMGTDPSTSVSSPGGEVHGVENLFLVDGSVFVSCPDKNPTLTILANCARVCDAVLAR